MASINPQAKQFVSLMFHQGAKIPGDFPSLSGSGDVARYLCVGSAEELVALQPELVRVVAAWWDMKDA